MAYKVACLGVTDSDWKMLGIAAMQAMKLDIARKSFIRIRDMKFIELLYVHTAVDVPPPWADLVCVRATGTRLSTPERLLAPPVTPSVWRRCWRTKAGTMMPQRCLPKLAPSKSKPLRRVVRLSRDLGVHGIRAIDMFADLGLWSEVEKFASENGSLDLKALMMRHAKWSEEVCSVGR